MGNSINSFNFKIKLCSKKKKKKKQKKQMRIKSQYLEHRVQ